MITEPCQICLKNFQNKPRNQVLPNIKKNCTLPQMLPGEIFEIFSIFQCNYRILLVFSKQCFSNMPTRDLGRTMTTW